MGVPNNKQHAQFARELWVGENPEDRDNMVHIADNKIDFENGALTIDANGLSSTTGDITAHVGRFTSDLLVGGLANFDNTVLIGQTAVLPGGETVSIDTTTGAVATTGTLAVTGAVSVGDATANAGLINIGDGATSATAIRLTGTDATISAGDATLHVGGLELGDGATSATNAIISGSTGYTSPYGAISIVQKTGVVQASTATATLGATALTAAAGGQDIVAGITNPDVPRNVTALGNAAGIVGNVVVTGTNWAGETITDTIALNGANEVPGVKAFVTVTKVHLPPETHAGTDTVSIGRGNCLGLQRPIAAAGSVIEVARKAVAAAEYTIEATGTVSVTNGTVDQSGVGAIVNDDRFEITYNASRL